MISSWKTSTTRSSPRRRRLQLLRPTNSAKLAIATALFLTPLMLSAQQRPMLRPLSREKAIDLVDTLQKQLPSPASADVDDGQTFILAPSSLTVAPAVVSPHANDPHAECGIFLGKSYVSVIKPEQNGFPSCESSDGVTLVPGGDHPALIALFGVSYGQGPDQHLPAVLTWNAASSTYAFDSALTNWLTSQPGSRTLLGAKRLIAKHMTQPKP